MAVQLYMMNHAHQHWHLHLVMEDRMIPKLESLLLIFMANALHSGTSAAAPEAAGVFALTLESK